MLVHWLCCQNLLLENSAFNFRAFHLKKTIFIVAVIRQNRKSAVELLEETKPYYVKSTFVRDQKQLPTGVENCYVSDIR